MKKQIKRSRFLKLQAIFSEKNWPLDSESVVFDNFCCMLSRLSEVQQDFILCLTEDFLWVSENEYQRLFYQAFNKFIKCHPFRKYPRIIIIPLLAPQDFNKLASSKFLYYLVEPNFPARNYASYNVLFLDSNEAVAKVAKPNDRICLIDDFIGAGRQAHDAIYDLVLRGVDRRSISIISLVIQNSGYKRCQDEENVKVYFSHLRERGISDNPIDTKERTRLMEEIEEIVLPPAGYNFGREKTEALVKMNRIPNNTFPVYWYTNGGRFPVAPFTRGK